MYLVFEVGGTKTRIGFSSDGKILDSSQVLPTKGNFEQFIPLLKDSSTAISGGRPIKACAGGVAGVLDAKREVLINAAHLPNWVGRPLLETLQNVLGVHVFLENDASLGGLGEATSGAGVNKGIVAYLTIGTGIGGTRIVNGKIDDNALGFEPGHQIISPEGLEFEQYISGPTLQREYGKPSEQIDDPTIWDEAAKRLSIGLTNTIVHWSPNIVILGGGLMEKIPLERIRLYLGQRLKIFPAPPEIAKAKLGELSGLHGALEYLRQNTI